MIEAEQETREPFLEDSEMEKRPLQTLVASIFSEETQPANEELILKHFSLSFPALEKIAKQAPIKSLLSQLKVELGDIANYLESSNRLQGTDADLFYQQIEIQLLKARKIIDEIPNIDGFPKTIRTKLLDAIAPVQDLLPKKVNPLQNPMPSQISEQKTEILPTMDPTICIDNLISGFHEISFPRLYTEIEFLSNKEYMKSILSALRLELGIVAMYLEATECLQGTNTSQYSVDIQIKLDKINQLVACIPDMEGFYKTTRDAFSNCTHIVKMLMPKQAAPGTITPQIAQPLQKPTTASLETKPAYSPLTSLSTFSPPKATTSKPSATDSLVKIHTPQASFNEKERLPDLEITTQIEGCSGEADASSFCLSNVPANTDLTQILIAQREMLGERRIRNSAVVRNAKVATTGMFNIVFASPDTQPQQHDRSERQRGPGSSGDSD